MKKFRKSKYFKLVLTGIVIAAFTVIFKYLVYNGSNFSANVSSFIGVFSPIIYGMVVAYLLTPIMNFFENKVFIKYYNHKHKEIKKGDLKRFRVFSIIITFLIVIFLLYAFFGTVLPQLYRSIESIILQFPTYYNNILEWSDKVISSSNLIAAQNLDEVIDQYSVYINNFTQNTLLPAAKEIVVNLSSSVINFVGAFVNVIIGFIVAVYLMGSKEKYIGMCKKIIYSYLDKEKANNLMVDLRFVNKTFGGFLVGKIVDSLIIGILCFIVLSILKMPYTVLVSVIVGVTNIIPFFGPWFGAVPSALLILLVDPKKCLIFIIFVVILQQLDGNIIGPTILGNSIGVSSFWIIVAITVFGGFFGVLGMIVGVPLLAVIYAFVRRNVNNRLKKRNLTIATNSYAVLDYINEDDEFINLEDNKSVKSTRYIELNPNEFAGEDAKKTGNAISKCINSVSNRIKAKRDTKKDSVKAKEE